MYCRNECAVGLVLLVICAANVAAHPPEQAEPSSRDVAALPTGRSFLEPLKATFAAYDGKPAEFQGGKLLQTWGVSGGKVIVHFEAALLDVLGLEVSELRATVALPAPSVVPMEPPFTGFLIGSDSTMLVEVIDGVFARFAGGDLLIDGGFALSSPDGEAEYFDFAVSGTAKPNGRAMPDGALSMIAGPVEAATSMTLEAPGIVDIDTVAGTMILSGIGLALTEDAAADLGLPALAGQVIGSATILTNLKVIASEGIEAIANTTPRIAGTDVKLGQLYGIGVAGREGTFPNGTNGLSMATTSCNVGTRDVPWLAPMSSDHPGIVMNLYRELGDRFEQIGASDVKHGFFALSSSQCTPCQNPSDSTFLGVGCSDTYAFSNNSDRNWLAPRVEWTPSGAKWGPCESHFDGVPVNCVRNHGSGGHTPVEHRLRVNDADLDNTGATYYYEAFYLIAGDGNRWNNIGHKTATMNWTGFTWSFSSSSSGTPPVEGAALVSYADDYDRLLTNNGEIVVGWKVTDLGGGNYRYNYVVFNYTFDPAIAAVSVPVDLPVQNVGSNSWSEILSGNPADAWSVQISPTMVTWTMPTDTNPIEWGYVHTFWFECASPPVTRPVTLDAYNAYGGGALESPFARVPQPACVCADLDFSGSVDLVDFALFGVCFGKPASSPGCLCADMTGDGLVNLNDFALFLDLFGKTAPSASPPDCGGL